MVYLMSGLIRTTHLYKAKIYNIKVFAHYEDILEDVVNKSFGNVLEFGVGTGNLTNKLLLAGRTVYGIEPSREMRMIAKRNCQKFSITDGDFLSFEVPNSIDTIVAPMHFII